LALVSAQQADLFLVDSLPSPACNAGTEAKATNVRLSMSFFIEVLCVLQVGPFGNYFFGSVLGGSGREHLIF
jgi:hypothetical protein